MAGESDEDYERKSRNFEMMVSPEKFKYEDLSKFSDKELEKELLRRKADKKLILKKEKDAFIKAKKERLEQYLKLKKEFEVEKDMFTGTRCPGCAKEKCECR